MISRNYWVLLLKFILILFLQYWQDIFHLFILYMLAAIFLNVYIKQYICQWNHKYEIIAMYLFIIRYWFWFVYSIRKMWDADSGIVDPSWNSICYRLCSLRAIHRRDAFITFHFLSMYKIVKQTRLSRFVWNLVEEKIMNTKPGESNGKTFHYLSHADNKV